MKQQKGSQQPPNILWICTDQQRYDTIQALGNEFIRTPNLDKLVETGVAFTHAYCQSPICTPSRASFLTGMYPSTVHACMNGNENWADAAPLVTKILADAGYGCGLAGKLHLSATFDRIEPRPDDGYRVFHWSQHPHGNWPEGHDYGDWLGGQGHDYDRLIKEYGYIPVPLHQTTWCTNKAIDFLKEERNGPWLFSLNCFDPHSIAGVFYPPREYLDRYDIDSLPGPLFRETDLANQQRLEKVNFHYPRPQDNTLVGLVSEIDSRLYDEHEARLYQAQYWSLIELIDENVGRLLQSLEETGQRDNTLVIFMSDHGEALGDHGLRRKGCRFYEGLVRVPLIISWPTGFKENLPSKALVELIDIAPTLLEIAGLPIPETMQGRSLIPIVTGQAEAHHHRQSVRSEFY